MHIYIYVYVDYIYIYIERERVLYYRRARDVPLRRRPVVPRSPWQRVDSVILTTINIS